MKGYEFLEKNSFFLKKEIEEERFVYHLKKGNGPTYYFYVWKNNEIGWDIEENVIKMLDEASLWFKNIYKEASITQFKKDRTKRVVTGEKMPINEIIYLHYVLGNEKKMTYDDGKEIGVALEGYREVLLTDKERAESFIQALKEERYPVDTKVEREGYYLKLRKDNYVIETK